LDVISFPKNASLDTITPEVVNSLAMLAGPFMLLLFVSTVFISRRYPLDKKRHNDIVAAIEAGRVDEHSEQQERANPVSGNVLAEQA